ncbi:MAG TPA: hypothetical protein VNO52_16205 [Methylomirabilota bacterium]|nr:hypothetical protein [Methylomirabilota bacterium]
MKTYQWTQLRTALLLGALLLATAGVAYGVAFRTCVSWQGWQGEKLCTGNDCDAESRCGTWWNFHTCAFGVGSCDPNACGALSRPVEPAITKSCGNNIQGGCGCRPD